MTKRLPIPSPWFAALLVAMALLWCAAPAIAYDPATDQYTPSTPSGGGSVPTLGEDNSDFGGTGTGGGSDSGAGGDSAPAPVPVGDTAPPAPDPEATGANGDSSGDGQDQRAVRDLAAQARQQRDALADLNTEKTALRAPVDASDDQGMGVFLPIVLALMLIAAVASRVARRHDGAHPA